MQATILNAEQTVPSLKCYLGDGHNNTDIVSCIEQELIVVTGETSLLRKSRLMVKNCL